MSGLLGGLRVVELGGVIAGTVGGMILADLGADVVKVERPEGDAGRRAAIGALHQTSAVHLTLNRNKRSIVLDLKDPDGRAVLLDLVSKADAVTENFRPGVLERLGLGFDVLREVREDLVLVSVSGFGQDGTHASDPAYDLVIQAMSGHMAINAEPGRIPTVNAIPLADVLSGVYSAVAVLAGLQARERGGLHVDLSMLDVMVSTLAHVGTMYLTAGVEHRSQAPSHPFITPWQAFACADGRYIVVAPREPVFWDRLVEFLDVDALRRETYRDPTQRHALRGEVLPLLSRAFASRPADHWVDGLRDAGVPAARVNTLAEAFASEQVASRGIVEAYDLDGQQVRLAGNPVKLRRVVDPPLRPAPALGQHTDDVLRRDLGYDDARIARLRQRQIIG